MSARCMSDGRSLYRIDDKNPNKGCHPLKNFTEAEHWNYQEWGIFWTVNSFKGPRRKDNCVEVIAWAVDIDEGTKEEQLDRIKSGPLIPSHVVETARGHHVYFEAIDGKPENYREIVESMVEYYHGDNNAKDLCRILRVPAFLHWKGVKPFAVKSVFDSESRYTEAEVRKAFERRKVTTQRSELRKELRAVGGRDLWERIWNLNCEDALERLSGHSAVNGETFTFHKTATGNLNICVNGKGTSCWIDKDKRIGSSDKGGPTIFQWIKWYTKSGKLSLDTIKEVFPEVIK